jgi:hypothetical protein
MGQQVVALMYGIPRKTKGLVTKDGDYFWDDFSAGVPDHKRYDWKKAPRMAYEGDVCGYPVASGPALDDGEGFLGDTVRLVDLEKKHARRIAKAKKKWDAFAAWAKKEHGKDLPTPELWFTTDERA